jgi:ABC-type phosphate/phosphonate transport system substrate-binding protein
MIATLPMYDWPELRESTDTFWQGLARHMRETGLHPPANLSRPPDHKAPWRMADFFFSQTCGYPFTHEFKNRLLLIGTPEYEADGCGGPTYCSAIFARTDNPKIAAINDPDSMSGMLALKLACGEFPQTLLTGGHSASLEAVQQGRADICAIDAVCVALARDHRPQLLEGLKLVTWSPVVPALPFVTSLARAQDVPAMRHALQACMADPSLAQCRRALRIRGFSITSPTDYDRITELEQGLT